MLSHVDSKNQAAMVDVGDKVVTKRVARALATVHLPAQLGGLISNNEINGKKGPLFQTARLAGVMAVKKTSELIPLCHPLPIEDCQIDITAGAPDPNGEVEVRIECRVSVHAKTGVEMEALTGATVAALTLYDMGKAVTHEIVIKEVRLVEKTGGKKDIRIS
jgi:cyclic pyranopterin monophosphate synthase